MRHMTEEHLIDRGSRKDGGARRREDGRAEHLPASPRSQRDYKRFAEEVKKEFTGPVLIANDLMEF